MATFSKNFTSNGSQSLSGSSGVPDSAITGISPQYIVTITATLGTSILARLAQAVAGKNTTGKQEFIISAFLQDKIILRAHSKWNGVGQNIPGFAAIDKWAGLGEFATQAAIGRSLITPITTRRIWGGSDPISMVMKLKFEAFNDPYREVILPCIGLQSLTLPYGGVGNTLFLTPPGPSPFDYDTKGIPLNEQTENIQVSIGGFLNFWSVVITDVNVIFENRMSSSGPIGAEVDVTIETYQMLTREDLMKVAQVTGIVSGNLGQGGRAIGNSFRPTSGTTA